MVPKALRDAMRLRPGQVIDIVYTDGRLEIEVEPLEIHIGGDGFPIAVAEPQPPPLTGETVRDILDETRR